MADYTQEELAKALTLRLAGRDVSDKMVKDLASRLISVDRQPIGVDICQFGICIDYRTPRKSLGELINRLERDLTIRGVEIFPEGIINPDAFRIRVGYNR